MKTLLLFILLFAGSVSADYSHSFYNPENDQIFIRDGASDHEIQHENCHRFWFWNLTSKQRYQWTKKFYNGLPYCHSEYPFNSDNPHEECFAEVCSEYFGTVNPDWTLQYWYGEDRAKSWQYLFIKNILK